MAAEALSRQGGGGGRSDRRVTIAQIKEEGLGFGEKPDWVQVGLGWVGGWVGSAGPLALPRPGFAHCPGPQLACFRHNFIMLCDS